MSKKWFPNHATGINNDLERHRDKETELRELIDTADTDQIRKAYQNLLSLLLDSKANVADKVGRRVSDERNH